MMDLFENQRNNRGVHGAASCWPPARDSWDWWISELRALHVAWYKLLDEGHGSAREFAVKLRENGITPIVRLFRPEPYPGTLPPDHIETIRSYVAEGIVLFEIGNEPNLDVEWKPDWRQGLSFSSAQHVNAAVDDWLTDAQSVLNAGGYPAFPALAPTDRNGTHPTASSVMWATKMTERLRDHRRDVAREVFARGAWLAAHISPRDRPFEFTPNRGSFYDDCCLQGFRVCLLLLQNNLEVVEIPVIATHGGVFTPERMEKDGWGRPYDYDTMAQKTVQMYAWLAENEPQVVAICPWVLANRKMGHHQPAWDGDEWYQPDGSLPVVASLRATPAVERVRPPEPIEVPEQGAPIEGVFGGGATAPGLEPATAEPGEGATDLLGLVQGGEFRLVSPKPSLGGALRLTSIGMQEAQPPETGELDLSAHEGQAIMVRGRESGGWVYSARIVDRGGPILTALVRQVFG